MIKRHVDSWGSQRRGTVDVPPSHDVSKRSGGQKAPEHDAAYKGVDNTGRCGRAGWRSQRRGRVELPGRRYVSERCCGCKAPKHDAVQKGVADEAVGTVDAARHLAGRVESWDRVALAVQHLKVSDTHQLLGIARTLHSGAFTWGDLRGTLP
jgi:hypothetical protein